MATQLDTILDEIFAPTRRALDTSSLVEERELERSGSAYPGLACVTPGHPYVLHCFPPFKTQLTAQQHHHLDRIARRIQRSFTRGRPITRVTIIGHSSTWHQTSADRLEARAIQRAGNAGNELILRLHRLGLAKRVRIDTEGRSDRERWRGKPYSSTSGSRQAQRDRALNRRVEIYFGRRPKRTPKPKGCTDKELARRLLDLDIDTLGEDKIDRARLRALRSMITDHIVDSDPLNAEYISGWRGLRSSTHPKPVLRNFLSDLKERCCKPGADPGRCFEAQLTKLIRPLDQVNDALQQLLIELPTHPFGGPSRKETLAKTPECRAARHFLERAKDPASLYRTLRRTIRTAFKECA